MSYLWCNRLNFWCSDTDEEDHESARCDGDCRVCDNAEEVSYTERYHDFK